MLIGRNVPIAFQPLNVIYGTEEEPWAEQNKFGLAIIGRVCRDEPPSENIATVNRISVSEKIAISSPNKDITSPREIREMMKLDYNELHYARNVDVS